MATYVARSGGHKITKRWCMDMKCDHGGDAHEMMIIEIKHEEMDTEQSDQGKGIIIGFAFASLR
jgi:hypothetical protein